MISFAPLWRTMERKKITQYQLIQKYYVSTGTLDALRKNGRLTGLQAFFASAEKPKRDAEHNTRPLYHFTVPGGGRGGDHSGAQTG